nr:MAG TPA: Deoxynucleoside kinase [Caudoviricetes sp.]
MISYEDNRNCVSCATPAAACGKTTAAVQNGGE